MVAIVQLAITAGASVGGFLFDASGYQSTFGLSAAIFADRRFSPSRWRASTQPIHRGQLLSIWPIATKEQ